MCESITSSASRRGAGGGTLGAGRAFYIEGETVECRTVIFQLVRRGIVDAFIGGITLL
jgi:hypothetical protein